MNELELTPWTTDGFCIWDANGNDVAEVFDESAEGIVRAVNAHDGLVSALRLLLAEVEKSGNGEAKDFGWPKAIEAARAAIATEPQP